MNVIRTVVGAYLIIGALHTLYFGFVISLVDCLAPKGLVYVFCNTGMGISHLVIMFGWPFYYA